MRKNVLLGPFFFLFLCIMVLSTPSTWAGGLDDAKAGLEAYRRSDYDGAIRLFTQAINSRELSQENLARTYFNRGLACSKKRDDDRAIQDYTKAIELNPKYALAYRNRGFSWKEKGEYDRAIQDCTKAIELDPKYQTPISTVGGCGMRRGTMIVRSRITIRP